MKKNILFSIGIMMIVGLSLVWFVQNVPRIELSRSKEEVESKTMYQGDLKLGDEVLDEVITVYDSKKVEVPWYYDYSSISCSSCNSDSCKSTEASKTEGKYDDSACDACGSGTCYEQDHYSNTVVFSVNYTKSDSWLMTDGDSMSCSANCSVSPSGFGNCSVTGHCAGGGTISASGGTRVYQSKMSYKEYEFNQRISVTYCAGGWSKGGKTAYISYASGQGSSIVNSRYYYTEDTCKAVKVGGTRAYKCNKNQWKVRCGGSAPLVSVCVYKPSSIGGDPFKNADGYAWTDDPDQYTDKGWVIDESKTKDQCGGCFGNATTLAASTSVKWGVGEHGVTGYKLDEVPSGQCYARETPKVCEPVDQNGSPTESKETDKCDDEENVYFVDGKWCNGGEPFYEIKCLNKYANEFDLEGKDVEVEEDFDIKQGVSVGIEVKTEGTKLCSAKFFSGTWDTVYFQVIEKLKAVDIEENSVRNAADVNEQRSWYITVLTKVLKQVNEYIDWKAKNEHNPTVKVELKNSSGASQKLNSPRGEGGQTVINFQYKPCTNGGEGKDDPNNSNICIPRCKFNDFDDPNCFPKYGKIDTNSGGFSSTLKTYKDDIEKDREGKKLISIEDYGITFSTAKISFRAKLNESKYVSIAMPEGGVDLSKVKNFMWYTEDKDEVTLIPPKVSLNWLSGEVLGSTTPIKVVDGYNRLYTDEEAEKGEQFKLEVHLENIGSSKSRVFDNICKLNVVETELTYRTIEETNPFINESRKKGYNWYRNGMDGTLYDFTKVIQGGGGYSASYEFSRDAIKSVKASNASLGKEAYLGACYLGLDSTSAICSN